MTAFDQLVSHRAARRHQDVPALASRPRGRGRPVDAVRERKLSSSTARRCTGSKELRAALAALRPVHGQTTSAKRSARRSSRRRSDRPAKADTLKMVHDIEAALEQDISTLRVDDRRNQEAGARQAARGRQQDRLPRSLARLQRARRSSAATRSATSQRANAFEFHARSGQDRQAGRHERMGHDAADGQRVLLAAGEQHQLPGRHPAAAVLQREGATPRSTTARAGAVIGHELTHGFDDQGRQFDAQGNLNDWWTPDDAKAYEQRTLCIADEYSSFSAVDDVKLNGKLTLGENTADNGGLRLALMAYLARAAAQDGSDRSTASRRSSASSSASARSGAKTAARNTSGCRRRPIRTRPADTASTASCRTCPSSRRRSRARPMHRWSARTRAACGDTWPA